MSERKMLQPIVTSSDSRPPQNVEGWERIGSLAGGVVMVGKGLRRGGVFGLVQVALGGVALARGITGHSSAKSLLEKARQDMTQVRSRIERAGDELRNLKANADVARPSTEAAATGEAPKA
ncbi:DUF2892 domain-containing protein [Pseudomonas sp. NFXW11]|uniref:YgaP family membrane protein n=1 Tax=Pseudomonas sp. NFXW11 TaxID=2819531 RepID=UPI003CE72D27